MYKNEQQEFLVKVRPYLKKLVDMYNKGEFNEVQGKISNAIMNGDVVRTVNHGVCVVEIQGYQGSYGYVNGEYRNLAIGNIGFLYSLETGEAIRFQMINLRVLKRAMDM